MISQYGNVYSGLSTDTKPSNVALNGREFDELDTSKVYKFDKENNLWRPWNVLSNADVEDAEDGQILQYDAEEGKWVPATVTGATVDDSLTLSGQAADAKAAGDRIGALEEAVAGLTFSVDDSLSIASENPVQNKAITAAKADIITSDAAGKIAEFNDGAPYPVTGLVADFTGPTQEGSGTPSPSNIRRLVGRTGVRVWVSGKNLCGGALLLSRVAAAIPTATADESTRTVTFASDATLSENILYSDADAAIGVFVFQANTQYTFLLAGLETASGAQNLKIVYTDGTESVFDAFGASKSTVRLVSESGKTVSCLTVQDDGGSVTLYCDECGVFEGSVAASAFVPYTGEQHDITFPSYYSGKLDAVAGKLYSDYGLYALKDLTWHDVTVSGVHYYCAIIDSLKDSSKKIFACEAFMPLATRKTLDSSIQDLSIVNATDRYYNINVRYDAITTLSAWESWLADNNPRYLRSRASQSVGTFTPAVIPALYGENHVWSDTNKLTLKYRADTELYLKRLTQPTEDDLIANANIASGLFFMAGSSLYLSTASIAKGDTITPGVNCAALSLAEALNQLNA